VQAHDSLNPGRPPRFDAPAADSGVFRAVLMAPSLAILLVLAAAGAASAADGLDLVEAAPVAPVVRSIDRTTVTPTIAELGPVKDRALKTPTQALPNDSAQAVEAIVRGAEDLVGWVAPVPIPAVVPPDLYQDPDDIVQPRRFHPPAIDGSAPTAVLMSAIATFLVAAPASSPVVDAAQPYEGNRRPRPLQPGPPLGSFIPAGTAAFGGSATGPGPWLGHGAWPRVPPPWRSGFPTAIPFVMPRGLTPGPLVPPG
jgi:hypothetical protein